MTPQSMIKKLLWISVLSWMFTGSARAQCIHEAGTGGAFHIPSQGDLLVFGITVLGLWGLSAWLMNRFVPMSTYFGGADEVHTAMQNEELVGLQEKTDEALSQMESEYEEMILNRLDQAEDNRTSDEEAEEFRSQRAASL